MNKIVKIAGTAIFFCSTGVGTLLSQNYTSYKGLVMAGYQGWFTAEGDSSDRKWHHYQGASGSKTGSVSIDFWPDTQEYSKKYKTDFQYPDGTPAFVFSSYDEETTDLHFRWMKSYTIRFAGRNAENKLSRCF
jgi:hypothetical protein